MKSTPRQDVVISEEGDLDLSFLDSPVIKELITEARNEYDDKVPIHTYEVFRTIQICMDLIIKDVDARVHPNISVVLRTLAVLSARVEKYGVRDAKTYYEFKPKKDD